MGPEGEVPRKTRGRAGWIILIIIAAIVAVVALKLGSRPEAAVSTVGDEIEQALASGLPALFVFTYNGDCCESTREFFDAYNAEVSLAAGELGSRLNLVWLDTSKEDEVTSEAIMDLAARYEVTRLPSLLLVDGSGMKLWLQVGPISAADLREDLSTALGEG